MQPTLFRSSYYHRKNFSAVPLRGAGAATLFGELFQPIYPPADKADVIAQLWAAPPEPGGALKSLAPPDETLGLSLALCDRMAQDGEYTTVQHHLTYAAHKILFSIASGAMPMPHPPLKHLARLCHMALKWQIIQPTMTGESALNDVWQNFCQLAQLPAAFSAIALAREQVDWHVLHQSISLLCSPHDNAVVSPTVLYNPIHQDSIKDVARYLRDELTLGLNLAREKLKQLLERQMLLLPMMSVPICPYEGTVLTGHFSAVVAVEKDEYWHFAIFDSLDDSATLNR